MPELRLSGIRENTRADCSVRTAGDCRHSEMAWRNAAGGHSGSDAELSGSRILWHSGHRLLCARAPTEGTRIFRCCHTGASALWLWFIPPGEEIRHSVLEITAIDVGQGDAIFLATPERRKVLVDAGGLPFWTHSQLDI